MITSNQIAALKSALPHLPTGKKDFASSLIAQFNKKGALSDKQAPWVGKLLDLAAGVPEHKTASVGDLSALHTLFDVAQTSLKRPGLTLKLGERTLRVYRAGSNSKHPGAVNVVDRDEDLWFGRVSKDGTWTLGSKVDDVMATEVGTLLTRLAATPAIVAAEYGKLTGDCCFCAKALTDPKSTTVGYGPTCAKKWGMPWGA